MRARAVVEDVRHALRRLEDAVGGRATPLRPRPRVRRAKLRELLRRVSPRATRELVLEHYARARASAAELVELLARLEDAIAGGGDHG